jgi:hypothetical protein
MQTASAESDGVSPPVLTPVATSTSLLIDLSDSDTDKGFITPPSHFIAPIKMADRFPSLEDFSEGMQSALLTCRAASELT